MIRCHRFQHVITPLALLTAACTAPAAPIAAPTAAPAPAASAPPAAPAAPAVSTPTLINASTTAAYNAGVYDGFITVGELRARADFGLGATDKNDGEMTVLDGVYYRARVDGTVTVLRDDEAVPLASVTAFHPDRRLHLTGPLTRAALEARLEQWLPEANRMFAIRIHGRFSHIAAGSTDAQTKPYRRFGDIYAEYHFIARDAVTATLAGFRMPGVRRPDYYHFHLISDDKRAGGHVEDEIADDIDVSAQELQRIEIIVPNSPAFLAADLGPMPSAAPPAR